MNLPELYVGVVFAVGTREIVSVPQLDSSRIIHAFTFFQLIKYVQFKQFWLTVMLEFSLSTFTLVFQEIYCSVILLHFVHKFIVHCCLLNYPCPSVIPRISLDNYTNRQNMRTCPSRRELILLCLLPLNLKTKQ